MTETMTSTDKEPRFGKPALFSKGDISMLVSILTPLTGKINWRKCMSTLEAAISMLEIMPEESRQMVFEYTQELFASGKSGNPFRPVSKKKILKDLEISRQQASQGKVQNMAEAIEDLRKRHGYI